MNRDEELYPYISDIFHEFKGTYGVVIIRKELLNRYGWIVNHKCIRRIMHKYHLVCALPKPKFKRHPQPHGNISNVLNREFYATQPLQKLCMDITYVKVKAPYPKWAYLCAVKDLYNQEIVAYDVCESQNMAQVYRVLEQLSDLPLAENALLHTDQRYQFTNKNYIKKSSRYRTYTVNVSQR
ncbi:IS3 family transposase [Turicibacter sanguinis]|uniref:IS3 family transposase n=1 Tax=Turicibacter sanguinis TaxID=154288 RepID=UPI0018A9633C|nr:IS3 family transposase [Turicibacter sanguinis]MDB8553655.1 IS3 family transposase [Turicibacter sanguinis]